MITPSGLAGCAVGIVVGVEQNESRRIAAQRDMAGWARAFVIDPWWAVPPGTGHVGGSAIGGDGRTGCSRPLHWCRVGDASVVRLIGAVLLEQHEDRQIGDRRYFSEASMAKLYPERDNEPALELTTSDKDR